MTGFIATRESEQASHDDLRRQLQGEVIGPADPGYDQARAIWNGAIDRRPQLIVRAVTEDDVVVALRYAAREGLQVSVRGGGHNVAGTALCDDLVLDLSLMRGVVVDPQARRARVEGGALWSDLDAATQAHGLVVPGGIVSTTGVAGLTLRGGLGWVRRSLGLSSDQVVSFEVVLADGSRRHVDRDHHADLFRALRGGGGGFCVVTAFEFALHPLGPDVAFAFVAYPLEDGLDVLRAYREFAEAAPDEVTSTLLFSIAAPGPPFPEPAWGRRFVAVAAMYAGGVENGLEGLEPLRGLGGVTPLLDLTSALPYTELQSMFDEDEPAGREYYWTSTFLRSLPDDALVRLLDSARSVTSPSSSVALYHLGGAIDAQEDGASAYPSRGYPYLFAADGGWDKTEPARDEPLADWSRRTVEMLSPYSAGLGYTAFSAATETDRDLGGSARPVAEVARTYDPTGLFAHGTVGESRPSAQAGADGGPRPDFPSPVGVGPGRAGVSPPPVKDYQARPSPPDATGMRAAVTGWSEGAELAGLVDAVQEAGWFERLRDGSTAEGLADGTGVPVERVRLVLAVLAAAGVLVEENRIFRPAAGFGPVAAAASGMDLATMLAGRQLATEQIRRAVRPGATDLDGGQALVLASDWSMRPTEASRDRLRQVYEAVPAYRDRLEAGGPLLDVGCGVGGVLLSTALAYPALSAVGVDIVPEVAAEARRRTREAGLADRVEIRAADARDLADVAAFGACFWAHPFFAADTRAATLATIHRALGPGGLLLVQELFPPRPEASTATVRTLLDDLFLRQLGLASGQSAEELAAEAVTAGFLLEEIVSSPMGRLVLLRRP